MKDKETHSTSPAELAAAKNIDDVREWFLGIGKQISQERARFTRSVVWVALAGLSLTSLSYWVNHRTMTARMAAMQKVLDQEEQDIGAQITKLGSGLEDAEMKRKALEQQSRELEKKQNALQQLISDGEMTVNNLKTVDEKVNQIVAQTKTTLGNLVNDSTNASLSAKSASDAVTAKLATLSQIVDASKASQEKAETAANQVYTTVKEIKNEFNNLNYQLENSSVSRSTGQFVWKGGGPFSPPNPEDKRPSAPSGTP